MNPVEQRRTRRFQLTLPLSIVRAGAERIATNGHTHNISSSGVLFTAEMQPEMGGPIEYVITLNQGSRQGVSLRCMGKVLRSQPSTAPSDAAAYQVAATLERYEFIREQ